MTYKSKWVSSDKILPEDLEIPVTQVYCWLMTSDDKVVIVSKDGLKWQLPGGHPLEGESFDQTVKREMAEETGIDISGLEKDISVFGYYVIEEFEEEKFVKKFIQVRTTLKLEKQSGQLALKPQEREEEKEEDRVRFAEAVSLDELLVKIPWMKEKEEYLCQFKI